MEWIINVYFIISYEVNKYDYYETGIKQTILMVSLSRLNTFLFNFRTLLNCQRESITDVYRIESCDRI